VHWGPSQEEKRANEVRCGKGGGGPSGRAKTPEAQKEAGAGIGRAGPPAIRKTNISKEGGGGGDTVGAFQGKIVRCCMKKKKKKGVVVYPKDRKQSFAMAIKTQFLRSLVQKGPLSKKGKEFTERTHLPGRK